MQYLAVWQRPFKIFLALFPWVNKSARFSQKLYRACYQDLASDAEEIFSIFSLCEEELIFVWALLWVHRKIWTCTTGDNLRFYILLRKTWRLAGFFCSRTLLKGENKTSQCSDLSIIWFFWYQIHINHTWEKFCWEIRACYIW